MTEIKEYLSNSAGSRDEKRVVNNPNLSENARLKRKRKMETETTSPRKRRRTEGCFSDSTSKFKRNKWRCIWSESDKDYLKKISSYDSFLSLDYEKPDWVNAEMKFTLSADSLSSWDSSYEEDQVKPSELPDYIKRLASKTQLADYDIGKVLGAGAFGQVVAATRKTDNLPVALKFVHKSSVKEFKKINEGEIPAEAYLQRQARHRHVIDVYDVIDTEEHYVYVMERPEVCKDLFDIIQDRDSLDRQLTEREARRYFAQILQANINCEETGVLHRDIKPENILVDMRTDEAKLIDFGLASEVQQEPFTKFRGTPQYMPPEFSKFKKYDGCQGTVWQMGILLVDMLSPVVRAFEHPRHALRMAPRVPQHLSPEVKNLIYSLLNTNPSNRPTLQQALRHPWFAMTD
ncbi:serine/threonine-protein kinase pim-3-like [Oculina patagonica]